jgi:phosphatidylglycerol:prolipoprotein diacylglycerol transferase
MGIIAFSLGDVSLYLYGIVVVIAILVGLLLTWVNVRQRGEAFLPVVDILLYGLPMGLVCARLGYVCSNWALYENNIISIVEFWQGGISIYGGFLGFIITIFAYTRWYNLNFLHWLDIFAPAMVAGVMIQMVGHFVMQTTVGLPLTPNIPNDHTLAEYIEFRFRPSGFENYEYFKPIALYQAVAQAVILLIVLLQSVLQVRQQCIRSGGVFLWGTFLLAVTRFVCGFFYLSATPGNWMNFSQGLALAASVLVLLLLIIHHRKKRSGIILRF